MDLSTINWDALVTWGKANKDKVIAITASLIIGTIVVWLAWDAYLGVVGSPTESRMLSDWSTWTVGLPYAVCVCCGHWWWPWRGTQSPYVRWRNVLNFSVMLALFLWDIENAIFGGPAWLVELRRPEFWCVLGFPMGHFFWGQRNTTPKTHA